MTNKLTDLIYYKIMLKKRDFNYPISHLTLGIDIINELRLLNDTSIGIYTEYVGKERGLSFYGYPIIISYRRKNLIQVNLKKPRQRLHFLTYDSNSKRHVIDYTSLINNGDETTPMPLMGEY